MLDEALAREFLNQYFIEVTKKMTGIEVTIAEEEPSPFAFHMAPGMAITFQADPPLHIVFQCDKDLLFAIVDKMKRSPAADMAEVSEYITEYLNVICGNVISAYNRKVGSSARFTIPKWLGDVPLDQNHSYRLLGCYEAKQGKARFLQRDA